MIQLIHPASAQGPAWDNRLEILRDSGRMTIEDLAQKHLGEDTRDNQFWNTSFAIIESQIAELEALLK